MSTPFETRPDRVVVDVWSDVMCPFCYIGDTHLARAIERADHRVEVRYHSYQLMPELPHDAAVNMYDLLEKERGMPRAQAVAMNAQVAARAAEVGLAFDAASALAVNTRTAHRLIHLAQTQGKQHEMVMRLFRAYFADGLNIGDIDTLTDLAAQVGVDRDTAREVLTSEAYDTDVEADLQLARNLGITGVPFFVIDGAYTVSGAQPVDVFAQALTTAWAAHNPNHTQHIS